MATFYTAFCIIQTLFGLGSRRDESRNTTDWLKLALAVAAQPEDEESKRLVQVALESNNQEFLDQLRAALNTRVAAAARLADIENDGIECRAFLPGSPALSGWTTNMVAESAILKAGVESAMCASVFDSPSPSCSNTSEDVFVGLSSSETMGGGTLRDIYAKAWELHREPLIWTPRGPGAGVGASTWTLTPLSLTSQGAKTRNRSVSDASESRSSIVGQSPCLQAQRNRTRRDSLHDIFTPIDSKKSVRTSPCAEVGIIIPSPSVTTPPLPSVGSEPPISRRSRRSTSCTRSHVSSTTAVTVSECSTTQELNGLGLGRSFDRSVWSRSDTPTDSCFGDCESGEVDSKGKRTVSSQAIGGRNLASSAAAFRRNKALSHSNIIPNSKQTKPSRPGVVPPQSSQTSVPKRPNNLQQLPDASSTSKNRRDVGARTSRLGSIVTGVPGNSGRSQELSSLRRVRSVAALTPSPLPRGSRAVNSKAPLIGPVPAARRVSIKQDLTLTGSSKLEQNVSLENPNPNSSSVSSVSQRTTAASRIPSTSRSQIPRPASRAGSVSIPMRTGSPMPTTTRTPKHEPQQLPTPTSTVRVRERASSQAPHPAPTGGVTRARSRTGSSTQDRPAIVKDIRLSCPSSRAHIIVGPNDLIRHRSRRSDSVSTMADRWEPAIDNPNVPVAA